MCSALFLRISTFAVMKPTLRQIAKELNVSPSTVSRALSNDSGVSSDRAEEIRAFAEKHGYRPQPMRRGMNRTIGLVVSSDTGSAPDDSYQNELLSAVVSRIGAEGWHLQHEYVKRGAGLPTLIRENRVDGVLLTGGPDRELCDAIRNLNVPAVALDDLTSRTGLFSVIADARAAMIGLVSHLREIGHRKIALVASAKKFPTMVARVEGFRDSAKKLESTIQFTSGDVTLQQGQIATRQLFAAGNRPTAIIYATDILAVGGLIELMRLGISVPAQVSIAGCDNTIFSQQLDPSLTSIDLNLAGMVDAAFTQLRNLIANDAPHAPRQTTLAAGIVWRASCSGVVQSNL